MTSAAIYNHVVHWQESSDEAAATQASYADDVALLLASAQNLKNLLDSMESFCSINSLPMSFVKLKMWSLARAIMGAPERLLDRI